MTHRYVGEIEQILAKRAGVLGEIKRIKDGDTVAYQDGLKTHYVNYSDYTEEKRAEIVAGKLNELEAEAGEYLDKRLQAAQREYDRLAMERERILTESRMTDPLNPGHIQNALTELEAVLADCRNLGEFVRRYEGCQDPYLSRAFQVSGATLARRKWGDDPANGSFAKRLSRDRAQFYETDKSRAVLEKMSELKNGVDALANFARGLYREKSGITPPPPGTFANSAQQLQWAIADDLATGKPQPGSDVGRSGGQVYIPRQLPQFSQ